MKPYQFLIPFLVLGVFYLSSCQESGRLFNSTSTDWIIRGNAHWKFQNNMIEGICKETEGFVMTNKAYDNFELRLEFFPDSTINSGVFVRCKDYVLSATECHEMNIWDLHPNQEFRTGSIVTKSVPFAKVNTLNRWNRYKITCLDNEISVWVNDTLTANYEDMKLNNGYIGLQASGKGTIKFRNIHLKEL